MSATINTGWLKGKNGVKFAPKTLSSQVITNDGIALEEKIAADLNEIKTYIDETVSGNEGSSGSTGNTGGTSSSNGTASDVSYDDQQTQLGVNNVQDAIGELAELFKSLSLSYSNNILYLSLNGVVISSCTIVPTVVGSISLDNIISIDNLQSGVYTLKYENDESILDGVENICELEVF